MYCVQGVLCAPQYVSSTLKVLFFSYFKFKEYSTEFSDGKYYFVVRTMHKCTFSFDAVEKRFAFSRWKLKKERNRIANNIPRQVHGNFTKSVVKIKSRISTCTFRLKNKFTRSSCAELNKTQKLKYRLALNCWKSICIFQP